MKEKRSIKSIFLGFIGEEDIITPNFNKFAMEDVQKRDL